MTSVAPILYGRIQRFTRTVKINFIESYQFLNLTSTVLKVVLAPAVLAGSLRLSVQLYRLDDRVRARGFRSALIWILHRYYAPSQTSPVPESVKQGPLLVLCNHPGLGDFLALLEMLPRSDVRVIVKQRELLADKTHLLAHCIIMNDSIASKAQALQAGIRHLQKGGMLAVFPAGEIEDEPGNRTETVREAGNSGLKPWIPVADSIARRCMRAGIPLTILPAAIDNVYHVPWFLRPWVNKAEDAATRSGRAAIITMITPRNRNKSIRVNFLEPMKISVSDGTLTETIRKQISDQLY
ncbi:1-acyl-sn-glycerol-3-phosphate acyltransferase [Spirochaeta dissipatitropha]